MATTAQVKSFISSVGSIALTEAIKRRESGKKWVLPSICVAQGACESAWGTSPKMVNANALFGIKVGKSKWHFGTAWKDKAYSTKTKECYDGKNYTAITDMFRAYDTVEESVEDYFDLITGAARYSAACNNSDARSTITAIKNGDYATSPTYINTIMSIYNSHPEIAALDAAFLGKCYGKYIGTSTSIVNALKAVGEPDTSFKHRKKIAVANNISNYSGTASQNTNMLNLLKQGKLKKA